MTPAGNFASQKTLRPEGVYFRNVQPIGADEVPAFGIRVAGITLAAAPALPELAAAAALALATFGGQSLTSTVLARLGRTVPQKRVQYYINVRPACGR